MTRTKILAAAAVSALTLAFGSSAWSATIYSLDTGNTFLNPYAGPYGSASVNLIDAFHADITFTANSVGQYDFFFVDGGSADVNVNAATWAISNLVTNGLGTLSSGGGGNVASFGTFNQTTNQTDSWGDRATAISFRLTDTSGSWASSDSVLTANPSGFFIAAHIGVCDTLANPGCTTDGGAAVTGFAAGGPGGGGVPEPATWGMMLVGLFGMGALMRARRRAPSAV